MPARASGADDLRSAIRKLQRTNQDTVWALQRVGKFLATLQQQLSEPGAIAALRQPKPASRPRRKLKLSPERRAALKLQGQYLGYMRGLKPRQKSQVKKIRAAKGVRAAIAAAKRLAS